jgi:hypothetical protein
MISFKKYIMEMAVARRPEKITVHSLHKSGGFNPDETGHVNIRTYHSGHFGESPDNPLSPGSVVFPSVERGIFHARPQNYQHIDRITPNQAGGSFYGLSTTPDALAASMYRGHYSPFVRAPTQHPIPSPTNRTYEINLKVHKDNIKHFTTFHDMVSFISGEERHSPFHEDNERYHEYRTFLESHPTHGETFRKINVIHRKRLELERKFVETPKHLRNTNQRDQWDTPEHRELSKQYWDLFGTIEPARTDKNMIGKVAAVGRGDRMGVIDQMKHKFLTDRMGLHVLTSKQGSGRAERPGEIMVLHGSPIRSITDVTDHTNEVRSRYARILSHPLSNAFPDSLGYIRKFLKENKRTEAEQKAFSLGFEHGFFNLSHHADHKDNPHYLEGHKMGMEDAVFDTTGSGTRWSSMGPDGEIINRIW